MNTIFENWIYKPNKYEYSEYDGRADLANLKHQAWIIFETNDSEEMTRNRLEIILQWIYENELILKKYAADNGAYENWGAEYTDYTKEQFIDALRLQEVLVSPDYSFSVYFFGAEETDLYHAMGGHGPYLRLTTDFELEAEVGFSG